MDWMHTMGESALTGKYMLPPDTEVQSKSQIRVIDILSSHSATVAHLDGEDFVTTSIVNYSLIPCAPFSPMVAFTIHCLELYRISHNRCPHLSIHAFIKSICDLHSLPFKSHISRQFSISYDLYLSMHNLADELTQKALGRDSEDWRLCHVCHVPTYLKRQPAHFHKLYKADEFVEKGGASWDHNHLKVYRGLRPLSICLFRPVSALLVDTLSTFTATELLSYNDFVLLSVFSAQAYSAMRATGIVIAITQAPSSPSHQDRRPRHARTIFPIALAPPLQPCQHHHRTVPGLSSPRTHTVTSPRQHRHLPAAAALSPPHIPSHPAPSPPCGSTIIASHRHRHLPCARTITSHAPIMPGPPSPCDRTVIATAPWQHCHLPRQHCHLPTPAPPSPLLWCQHHHCRGASMSPPHATPSQPRCKHRHASTIAAATTASPAPSRPWRKHHHASIIAVAALAPSQPRRKHHLTSTITAAAPSTIPAVVQAPSQSLGLEDLEGCERFFAKSNALAPGTWHASMFHRHQAISEYALFTDKFETYANLSTFLLNNYKQALSILQMKLAVIAALTKIGALSGEVVQGWLWEEEAYLRGLLKEPLEETLKMEYYKMLESLRVTEHALTIANSVWTNLMPNTIGRRDATRAIETARRHAIELHEKDLCAVQLMEKQLNITGHWMPKGEEWKTAAEKVSMRQYQRCLDTLEGLVVAQMFELTKVNMSQTGLWRMAATPSHSQARVGVVPLLIETAAMSPPPSYHRHHRHLHHTMQCGIHGLVHPHGRSTHAEAHITTTVTTPSSLRVLAHGRSTHAKAVTTTTTLFRHRHPPSHAAHRRRAHAKACATTTITTPSGLQVHEHGRTGTASICTAVARYNIAAAALSPPHQELSWDEVIDWPWVTPATHQAMDGYFKLLHTEEEITHLNVEIHRFLMFMRDEDIALCSKEKEVGLMDPALAYQIHMQRTNIAHFTPHHVKNLNEIQQLPGFSGNLSCGVHITGLSLPAPAPLPPITSTEAMVEDGEIDLEANLEEEQAGEDEE
ncbi:hypothetical protein BJV78DRAFT_1287476 [Lactifluus subvellereus]|nr:hypothetical protein BJV78DRAFT_1287476 [Lactifluus subvellereus]